MKKVLLSIVMVALGFTASAQVSFGIKAGVNLADLAGDDIPEEFGNRTSFHIGGVAEFEISKKFSFQPELLYSSQGTKAEEDDYKVTLKMDYLNIPLMAKYYVTEGLSFEVGPQVGFLLSAKEKGEFDGDSETEDIKDFMNSVDFGLNFGLGYKLESGINFGARYNLGLSEVFEDVDVDDDDDKSTNGVFQISVGYSFN